MKMTTLQEKMVSDEDGSIYDNLRESRKKKLLCDLFSIRGGVY